MLKLIGSKVFKVFLVIIIFVIMCIVGIAIFRLFIGASNSSNNSNCSFSPDGVSKISSLNYTNVLKSVHENINEYVGIKISFTGYIYRVSDLKNNQFILARNMIISSDFKYVVVGFLCEYENTTKLNNDEWVEISGEITKGFYHGDMPILKVTKIEKVEKPNEEFVYPPSEDYIPTNSII